MGGSQELKKPERKQRKMQRKGISGERSLVENRRTSLIFSDHLDAYIRKIAMPFQMFLLINDDDEDNDEDDEKKEDDDDDSHGGNIHEKLETAVGNGNQIFS